MAQGNNFYLLKKFLTMDYYGNFFLCFTSIDPKRFKATGIIFLSSTSRLSEYCIYMSQQR